ncbi:MAG: LacI family transcriptional regulator [Chloroflexi bacterium]|nr:LacI family transcriptional regulator [Chloroflexota bacterium]
MRVSIKDIARAAGVSHSTVSRALSNSPLVSGETRDRIRLIAQELGYSPNAIARGLVTQQTRTVGVIVTTIADPFIGEVVRGIEELAADNGYRVFLGTSHSDPIREVNLVKGFREWRVDGVIVASSRVGALYIPLLNEIGVPVVLINSQQEGPYVHSVAVDNVEGAEQATRHLLSLGHRTVGYIGGPSDHSSHRDRLTGYRYSLTEAGLLFDPSLVLPGNGRADSGNQVASLLDHSPAATAVFCYNDLTAIGVVHALLRRGLRVPADLSVVGFDDIEYASFVEPPLTTIHQPKDEMGRLAMRMLIDLLNGDQVTNVMVPGELVVRESTREFAPTDLPVQLPA